MKQQSLYVRLIDDAGNPVYVNGLLINAVGVNSATNQVAILMVNKDIKVQGTLDEVMDAINLTILD
jgi:hypothetical protein